MTEFKIGDLVIFNCHSSEIPGKIIYISKSQNQCYLIEIQAGHALEPSGWDPDPEDRKIRSCTKGRKYWWSREDEVKLIKSAIVQVAIIPKLSCLNCGISSEYFTSNCVDGKFLCYSCRDTKKWAWEGILLS